MTEAEFWQGFARCIFRPGAKKLTPAELGLLATIPQAADGVGSLNLLAVAEARNVSPATASRAVNTLVTRGLVKMTADSADRRRVLLTRTQVGTDALATIFFAIRPGINKS